MSCVPKTPGKSVSPAWLKIDRLVYSLYGLTPEEIALVEGDAGVAIPLGVNDESLAVAE